MIPAPIAPDPCPKCGFRAESRTQMRKHRWSEHRIPSNAANFDKEIKHRRSIDVNREERRASYGYSGEDAVYNPPTTKTARQSYGNQNALDAPSTTTPPLRRPVNDLPHSLQSYHRLQTNFPSSESYDPPSEITIPNPTYNPKPIPPDVAAARLARMNHDLITACRTKPSLRHDQPASLRGNGMYTHVASQNPQHYNEPEFLPLGGPNRYQPKSRVEAELPEEVNKAYEMLQRAMREEERLQAMGDTTDPRVRYGALPKPPTTISQLPLPPRSQTGYVAPSPTGSYNAAFAPAPMIDTQMGGMGPGMGGERMSAARSGSAVSHDETPKSATSTTVDVNRDPRLKRRATDGVYGRR